MNLFTVPTASFRVLYGFFVIEHGRRHIVHFNATFHPTSAWVMQQLREAFPLPSLEILGRLVLTTHIGVIAPLLNVVSSWPLAWRDHGPVGSVPDQFRSAPDK